MVSAVRFCIMFSLWCVQTWISGMCYVKCDACIQIYCTNHGPECMKFFVVYQLNCPWQHWAHIVCTPEAVVSMTVNLCYKTQMRGAPFTLLFIWVLLGLEKSGVCIEQAQSADKEPHRCTINNQVPKHWRFLKHCLENTFSPLIF